MKKKQLLLIFKKLGGSSEVFAGILYNFDNELKIKGVVLADNFIARYNRLLKAGKVKEPLDSNYTKKLAREVVYLK